ncbi:hypothetical protein Pst134EA_024446 [Puccinia striiformis f. sp. tritici]|uniref:Uncharacterized protein n=1 Tax=Puccinia striiformis f. sp. tritici PST-78 TaxID=1165861 RepID=A0A0L0UYH5_9BASI|nr:hypothetical protein Pst134EA_024446 [Puccinia striiformis f. sp. tritici]KAH9444882.1 hypothetical protein Pst134EB_025136 [Puccinia striiformis f. sp. tritici]KAH9453578.1 hypothetical protein Pst134EA_024446 [Puccinia striiformis f. sp. tritici]KAI9614102.1 hypothetical protein KEM48_006169 [Puccinia striiformis f. sp. tritici PST-130]KNE92070.1 hypothetical protein PSTG_14545 [Puccinia striiformis f. sp. tritici PST-78]
MLVYVIIFCAAGIYIHRKISASERYWFKYYKLSQLTTEIDKLEIEFSDLDELTALINQRYTAWKDEGESDAYELKAILKFHAEIEQRGVKLTARLTTLRQKFTTKY